MAASKYVDVPAIINTIGCIYNNNELLSDDRYTFREEDFPNSFHAIVFEAIYNLHALGVEKVSQKEILDYLEQRPQKLQLFESNKGVEWLKEASEHARISSFDYYYQRMKKFTLLRAYESLGMKLDNIYDPDNILDIGLKQSQEDYLDNHSVEEINNLIMRRIEDVKYRCVDDDLNSSEELGSDIDEVWESLKEAPDIGLPLYDRYFNTAIMGARFGRLVMRSSASNGGKSRLMVADMLSIACEERYDPYTAQWIQNPAAQPVLYITLEQSKKEIQTMALAFIAGVNEYAATAQTYTPEELERFNRAKEIMKTKCHFFCQEMPDYTISTVTNCIHRNIREHNTRYIGFDYVSTTMAMMAEINKKTGSGLREDQFLFMLAAKLKEIAQQEQVFILTSTQVNRSVNNEDGKLDASVLRGAYSLADRLDFGCVMADVSKGDLENLSPILGAFGKETPDMKMFIYKNRANHLKNVWLWMKKDLGSCRMNGLFFTDTDYQPINVKLLDINVIPEQTPEIPKEELKPVEEEVKVKSDTLPEEFNINAHQEIDEATGEVKWSF